MHRLEEEKRKKVYKAIECIYHRDNRETTAIEVSETVGEGDTAVTTTVYRLVTKLDNSIGIMDFVYVDNYINDEDDKVNPIIREFTLDISNDMLEQALEIHGDEKEFLSSLGILKMLREDKLEGVEKVHVWFLKSRTVEELLHKYDSIDDTGKIVEPVETTREATDAEIKAEENSVCVGGSYE